MAIKICCLVKNNSFQISWTILISKCVEKSIFYPEYFHCNISEYFHWNIAKYFLWNISILNISTDMFLSFRIEFRNISTDVWNFYIITQNQNYKTLCCRIFHRNIEENRKHVKCFYASCSRVTRLEACTIQLYHMATNVQGYFSVIAA